MWTLRTTNAALVRPLDKHRGSRRRFRLRLPLLDRWLDSGCSEAYKRTAVRHSFSALGRLRARR